MEPAVVVRIHPGQSSFLAASMSAVTLARRAGPRLRRGLTHAGWLLLAAAAFGVGAVRAAGQVVGGGAEAPPEPIDSADVRGRARGEQARFERARRRLLPVALSVASGSDCDEIVGRFCLWFDERESEPVVEPPAIDSLRSELLTYLDSVQALVPGDGWVLGQRVWYAGEGGHWDRALVAARACGAVDGWWCAALQGLAYHGLGRFEDSERAFERALAAMDPEQAEKWREPRRALRSGVVDALEDADGGEPVLLDLVWTLADPSYLVPGNDRRTEHYARWTVAHVRENARNPYQIRWGRDLEELLVRFGWEVGWERGRTWNINEDVIIGHQQAAGRDYLPGADAVRDPSRAAAEDFQPGQLRPRSLYAPAYAPVVLPMEGQLAVFPRSDSLVVVATTYVPEDTTRQAGDDEQRPWMEAGDQAGLPDRRGLFLIPVDGDGGIRGAVRADGAEGVLTLRAPAGGWVVSAEAWSPPRRIEGRTRQGLRRDSVPRDVATVSDLLLVREEGPEPTTLEEAVPRALARTAFQPGARVGVVWEVNGLGWHPSSVAYDLSLEPAERGLFRRLGEGLGLLGRDRPLALSWEEPGPERPATALRHVAVTLPEVDPGQYHLRLRVRVSGRSPVTSETRITIRPPH